MPELQLNFGNNGDLFNAFYVSITNTTKGQGPTTSAASPSHRRARAISPRLRSR